MPDANINGQRLYFEDSGGNGAPVILAHGFLMDHEMFAPQVAALAPEFRVIRTTRTSSRCARHRMR